MNLFAGSKAEIETVSNRLEVTQVTDYPWEGQVNITVNPERVSEFTVYLRIPGWARDEPLPGGLYSYLDESPESISLEINGDAIPLDLERGFVPIRRNWHSGDTIRLQLPVTVRRVKSRSEVTANTGLIAIERGPFVYCVEGIDNGGSIDGLHLTPNAQFAVSHRDNLLSLIHI